MRYLLNLPLLIAFVTIARVFDLAVLSREGGEEASYELVFETGITWLMLAVILTARGTMGGFRLPWPRGARVRGVGGFMMGLMAWAAIVLVSLTGIGITLEFDAAANWGIDQVPAARLVAFGLPMVLVLYAGWTVNAPAAARERPAVHNVSLGAAALLCAVAAVVTVREMAHEGRVAQTEMAAKGQEADEHADAQKRAFAALTDADPLLEWDVYVGDNVPKDVQAEALRRVAARPHLEDDLARALASDNWLWSEEAMALIVKLPFTPSAALAQPVRDAIAAYAARLTRDSGDTTYDTDKRMDSSERYNIGWILKLTERMAESASIDLSDSIDSVARAVTLYPRSDTAHSLPAQAAAAKARVAQILASRHG
jgi:hypothetical protein